MPRQLINIYTKLLDQHGPDSDEARAFLVEHADQASLQKRAGVLTDRARALGPHKSCRTCGSGRDRLMPMMARVPGNVRLKLGKLLGLTYGLGPGSGIELPMTICVDCGTVQGDWPLE